MTLYILELCVWCDDDIHRGSYHFNTFRHFFFVSFHKCLSNIVVFSVADNSFNLSFLRTFIISHLPITPDKREHVTSIVFEIDVVNSPPPPDVEWGIIMCGTGNINSHNHNEMDITRFTWMMKWENIVQTIIPLMLSIVITKCHRNEIVITSKHYSKC